MPPEVEAVLRRFYTCEFTTVNHKGQPVTWPSVPYFNVAEGRIVCAVSIAFPVKAFNARRHPQVALLFSDPTGRDGQRDPLEEVPPKQVPDDRIIGEPPAVRLAHRDRPEQADDVGVVLEDFGHGSVALDQDGRRTIETRSRRIRSLSAAICRKASRRALPTTARRAVTPNGMASAYGVPMALPLPGRRIV